jgi:hypothetical protein
VSWYTHDALCDEGDEVDMCEECQAEAERFLPDTTREDD